MKVLSTETTEQPDRWTNTVYFSSITDSIHYHNIRIFKFILQWHLVTEKTKHTFLQTRAICFDSAGINSRSHFNIERTVWNLNWTPGDTDNILPEFARIVTARVCTISIILDIHFFFSEGTLHKHIKFPITSCFSINCEGCSLSSLQARWFYTYLKE